MWRHVGKADCCTSASSTLDSGVVFLDLHLATIILYVKLDGIQVTRIDTLFTAPTYVTRDALESTAVACEVVDKITACSTMHTGITRTFVNLCNVSHNIIRLMAVKYYVHRLV